MSFSMVVLGSIGALIVLASLTIFSTSADQTTLKLFTNDERYTHHNFLSKTGMKLNSLNIQSKNATFDFLMKNVGQEKLWDYDNFDVFVTYDANVTGTKTRTTVKLSYNATSDAIVGVLGARPDADASIGKWTDIIGGDGDGVQYDEIDEVTRNDNDFTRSQRISNGAGKNTDQLIVSLSDIPDPETLNNHYVYYTYGKENTGGVIIDLTVSLKEGSTTIASWTHTNIGAAFTLAQQLLTTSQASSIQNYENLFLQFDVSCSTCTGGPRAVYVSWAGIEVHNGVSSGVDSNEWAITARFNDYIDPKIINTYEQTLDLGILEYPVWIGGVFILTIATDYGIIDSLSSIAS